MLKLMFLRAQCRALPRIVELLEDPTIPNLIVVHDLLTQVGLTELADLAWELKTASELPKLVYVVTSISVYPDGYYGDYRREGVHDDPHAAMSQADSLRTEHRNAEVSVSWEDEL